jgi:uncharacterized protein (UPF0210 family)
LDADEMKQVGDSVREVHHALIEAGWVVQTTRLAIQPFPDALGEESLAEALPLAIELQDVMRAHGLDYISLGPVRLEHPPSCFDIISEVLDRAKSVFVGMEIANRGAGIDLARTRRAAALIKEVAGLGADGFDNLRLAALANVGPWSPFFPAAYHGGGSPRVAIATESADLAVIAVSGASSLVDARNRLVRSVEAEAARIESVVTEVLGQSGISFAGIDFSLAPSPSETSSIGKALEQCGLTSMGEHGSLMAAAFLTDALGQAHFRRTGFCGLMLPVLEDAVLAHRAAEGMLAVADLLTFSAVCGTGLDTIPLPGDVSEDVLAGILLDVAALALRLDKPLTARLMPIPGKQAGDDIHFDFEFFADSRVMASGKAGLNRLLAGDERISLQPINR